MKKKPRRYHLLQKPRTNNTTAKNINFGKGPNGIGNTDLINFNKDCNCFIYPPVYQTMT